MYRVTQKVENILASSSIPSIAIRIFQEEKSDYSLSKGFANLDTGEAVGHDQVYDLASLTKVIVGTSIIAQLLHDGSISLDDFAARFVPGIDPRITIAHLLSHSSGLPAHIHFYQHFEEASWGSLETRSQILKLAQTTALTGLPGDQHRYSDLGFMVLCSIIEAVESAQLDSVFENRVLLPLEITGFSWGSAAAAATERCPIRKRLIQGEVHDLNCAAMGGVSTHAGIFGSASAVIEIAKAFLGYRESSLPQEAVKQLWAYQGPGSHRGGWDSISPGYSSTGSHFPADTVGHLGYTGTSLWLSPSRKTAVTLLTNRVHPTDDLTDIRIARPAVHDSLAYALGWNALEPIKEDG
jgi:CubicO group peptidase (beta-lactamase class C family)